MNGYSTMEVQAAAKRGRPKKQPLYGHGRFQIGQELSHAQEYGRDAHYEMVLSIMRWFWYTEKLSVAVISVKDAKDVRLLMESIYRKSCEKNVSDRNWPNVLELIYKPRIDKFFAMHGAALSELNLIS